jgi:hypothetical protein
MTPSARRWLICAAAGTISTALGVTVNIATNLMSSAWAWGLVAVLTVAGIVVGAGIDKGVRSRVDAKPTVSTPVARPGSATVGRGNAYVTSGTNNTVKVVSTPASTIVAIGLTVVVAVVAGLWAGGANSPANAPDAAPATGTSSETDGPGTDEPFALTVITDPQSAAFGTGFGRPENYIFEPGTVASLPAPEPEGQCWSWQRWAARNGGVRAGTSRVAFTVAAFDQPVRIHGARLVVERQPGPAIGDRVACVQGGPTPISHLAVDLDNETAIYTYPDEAPNAGQGRPLALDIAPGKSERVAVYAASRECRCRWHLELELESQGTNYTRRVDDDGEPFVIAPSTGQYADYTYYPTTGRWEQGIG